MIPDSKYKFMFSWGQHVSGLKGSSMNLMLPLKMGLVLRIFKNIDSTWFSSLDPWYAPIELLSFVHPCLYFCSLLCLKWFSNSSPHYRISTWWNSACHLTLVTTATHTLCYKPCRGLQLDWPLSGTRHSTLSSTQLPKVQGGSRLPYRRALSGIFFFKVPYLFL